MELKEKEVVKFHFELIPEGGNLTILTDPVGAKITVGGIPRGETPETVRNLKTGLHTVTLESGAWSWKGEVEIKKGETTIISQKIGALEQPAPNPEQEAVKIEAQLEEQKEQQASAPKRGRPDCKKICKKYSDIVEGSKTVKETINKQCMKRCETEHDLKFATCAWKAKTLDDMVTCNQIPVE